jgi:hypothetical protein
MLLALLDGRAAPEEIAGLARGSGKRKTPQLIEAIEGNRMSDHVRFLIRGCLRHLACLEEEVEELDAEILRRMQLSTFQKAFTLTRMLATPSESGGCSSRPRSHRRRGMHQPTGELLGRRKVAAVGGTKQTGLSHEAFSNSEDPQNATRPGSHDTQQLYGKSVSDLQANG